MKTVDDDCFNQLLIKPDLQRAIHVDLPSNMQFGNYGMCERMLLPIIGYGKKHQKGHHKIKKQSKCPSRAKIPHLTAGITCVVCRNIYRNIYWNICRSSSGLRQHIVIERGLGTVIQSTMSRILILSVLYACYLWNRKFVSRAIWGSRDFCYSNF